MTLLLLRVERHVHVRQIEPLSRRIRLAARRPDARDARRRAAA
ncbi:MULTISPECIES: hypothetical protein [unclassified Sphingomonas]|nr:MULTISPECIES: hypothetical protein [unclassified Sphingomonas]